MAKPRPQFPNTVFSDRNTGTKWPTLRHTYLTPKSVERLKPLSHGVVFIQSEYETRLNKLAKKPPQEQMLFFEHKIHPHKYRAYYLLCWIGNYYNGAVFHVAPQYPQCLVSTPRQIEMQCFRLYCQVARRLYYKDVMDPEVETFVNQHIHTPGDTN